MTGLSGLWVIFGVIVALALFLDLAFFARKAHRPSIYEALKWVFLWVALALFFNALVYFRLGSQRALEFLVGYLVEYSLSVDNLFVFVVIFSRFRVPSAYQHRVLFWGILGAVVIRAVFVAAGVALFQAFHWVPLVFGAFLVYTGITLATGHDRQVHLEKNPGLRLIRRFLPMTTTYEQEHFIVRHHGRLYFTPLLAVLILVETTDVVFAVDSIPAVLGVTSDPLIVYSSNIFAILGLRSLFFVLSGVIDLFRYLKYGLAVILSFVGAKMLISGWYEIPIFVSLGVIIGVLVLSVALSVIIQPADKNTDGR